MSNVLSFTIPQTPMPAGSQTDRQGLEGDIVNC